MDKNETGALRTRTWVLLIALFFLVSGALALRMGLRRPDGAVAKIYLDGVCIRTIDLSAVTEPYSFIVDTGNGENTVSVAPGRIAVTAADCPDQVCVRSEWRSGGAPIVCLPHRLVVRFEGRAGDGGIDAVSQ